jgi:hypothetical protein
MLPAGPPCYLDDLKKKEQLYHGIQGPFRACQPRYSCSFLKRSQILPSLNILDSGTF